MKQATADRKLYILFSVLAVALMWAAWLIAWACVRNEYVVPSAGDTVAAIGRNFVSAQFWQSFGNTMGRSVAAWLLSFLLAVACAGLSALSRAFARFLAPVVSVLRTVPTMAITLMLLIWTTPRTAPLIVAFLMLFPLTYAQLMAAYRGIDPKLFEMARVYRIGRRDVLFRICVPRLPPSVFAQAGANLSLSLKVMISAEVLASTFRSIGGMMQDASVYLQIADMFALTIVMLAAGGLLEFALGNLSRITDRWTAGRNAKGRRNHD